MEILKLILVSCNTIMLPLKWLVLYLIANYLRAKKYIIHTYQFPGPENYLVYCLTNSLRTVALLFQ